MNCALQANILAKYELNVSTMPRRYVRKRVAAWSTDFIQSADLHRAAYYNDYQLQLLKTVWYLATTLEETSCYMHFTCLYIMHGFYRLFLVVCFIRTALVFALVYTTYGYRP